MGQSLIFFFMFVCRFPQNTHTKRYNIKRENNFDVKIGRESVISFRVRSTRQEK